MNLFVKNTNFDVEVYVWEKEDHVEASSEKSDIPKEGEYSVLKFGFKHPSYADSTWIMQQATMRGGENLNAVALQDAIFKRLNIDWDIKDKDGNKVKFNLENQNSLQPSVVRAVVDAVLSKIKL